MKTIYLIASNTVREVVRQRIFANITIFGVVMLVFALAVSNITFGFPDRVVRSVGLAGASIATSLMSLLLAVGIIHREIDRQTLFVVLTRPVARWQYATGRYLGLVAVLLGVVLGFAGVFTLMLGVVGGSPSWADGITFGMCYVEAAVLAGFGLVLSSFSTPTLSAGIGLGFWLACLGVDDLLHLSEKASPVIRGLSVCIVYALPSFSRFNFREAAVYGDDVALGTLMWSAGYGLLYAVGFVLLAGAVLERRELG